MPPYQPDPPPNVGKDDTQEIMKYITEQFARISNELNVPTAEGIQILTKEPVKKEFFKIVGADGVLWNPGNGRGLYFWDGAWIPVAVVPADPALPPPPPPPPEEEPLPPGTPRFFFSWEGGSLNDQGQWGIQGKVSGRATLVTSPVRHGSRALRLHTEVGDNNVNGSQNWERNDATMQEANSRMFHGAPDEFIAHSFYLPDDFHLPVGTEEGYLFMDIHDNWSAHQADGVPVTHRANYNLGINGAGGNFHIQTHGGDSSHALWLSTSHNRHDFDFGPVTKNIWYDWVHQFRWRNNTEGFVRTWLKKGNETVYTLIYERLNQPTLYIGLECYLKLANYHGPYGVPSSVIHDRCVFGPDWNSVAMAPAA